MIGEPRRTDADVLPREDTEMTTTTAHRTSVAAADEETAIHRNCGRCRRGLPAAGRSERAADRPEACPTAMYVCRRPVTLRELGVGDGPVLDAVFAGLS